MGRANNLNFGNKVNYYEGVIVEIRDNDTVAIDVLGRLGYFEVPVNLIIAPSPLKVGQTVGWKMSFFEQLAPGVSDEFEPGAVNPDNTVYMEGIVSYVEDCAVAIEAKADLGSYKSPKRMLLSDTDFDAGQTVGWNISKFVQLGPEVNDKYVSNLQNREKRAKELAERNL